ncbi:putative serine/threonine-protein kinase [Cotonvirus japonicus]|uniref:Serine/threonine-protein kinase n=1 Tax=Cotonvirus japonicus TaxID=2811091 RepID=A0ABM7NSY9_9VIRU|nr:putative serine/threonine-protein kinase [Cotonvirus japonicus]BCS83290.1 putative serine/threonine-protein kinase [Cotonvirus japonicus]
MDFNNVYNKIKNFKINCESISKLKNKKLLDSGLSGNIIIDTAKNNIKFIIKIIPKLVNLNFIVEPNNNQLEIKFYQLFTKRYIQTNRTPHIVGIYNYQHCNDIKSLLLELKSNKVCPSYEDLLTGKSQNTRAENAMCNLILDHDNGLIESSYDAIILEHCPGQLSQLIYYGVEKLNIDETGETISLFTSDLFIIFFQIIFTLALIKEDYPGFIHRDLHTSNVLLIIENKHKEYEYIAYHYKQKIFYLPANGFYAKINDFDLSIIVDELKPNTYEIYKVYNKINHINPFDEKNDVFIFLYNSLLNIYDAFTELKFTDNKKILMDNFMNKFIDVTTANKLITSDTNFSYYINGISGVNLLQNMVLTPHEYLMSDIFEVFQNIPNNGVVIKHFNSPHK